MTPSNFELTQLFVKQRRGVLQNFSVVVLGGLLTVMAVATQAQTQWPEKPIRFIVPFTPGGGTDTVTRHLAEKITQDTQWSFLIDNNRGWGQHWHGLGGQSQARWTHARDGSNLQPSHQSFGHG